jgi:O-acetyl-ADP-ribose deacetylase (regulator of RNase III)
VVEGDLLAQPADALVNPWNRNFVPRWLLLAGGVSRQMKRRTGPQPWKDLARAGVLPLGGVHITDGGTMPCDLIHVAGLNVYWRATPDSVLNGTTNVIRAAWEAGYRHIASPLIGAGHGGMAAPHVRELMRSAAAEFDAGADEDALRFTLVIRQGELGSGR